MGTNDKRDILAAELAASVPLWPITTLKAPFGVFPAGSKFRAAPSSSGKVAYLVNESVCECPDYQRAGNICKHVRAVRLYEQQQTKPQSPKRVVPLVRYEDIFPEED